MKAIKILFARTQKGIYISFNTNKENNLGTAYMKVEKIKDDAQRNGTL